MNDPYVDLFHYGLVDVFNRGDYRTRFSEHLIGAEHLAMFQRGLSYELDEIEKRLSERFPYSVLLRDHDESRYIGVRAFVEQHRPSSSWVFFAGYPPSGSHSELLGRASPHCVVDYPTVTREARVFIVAFTEAADAIAFKLRLDEKLLYRPPAPWSPQQVRQRLAWPFLMTSPHAVACIAASTAEMVSLQLINNAVLLPLEKAEKMLQGRAGVPIVVDGFEHLSRAEQCDFFSRLGDYRLSRSVVMAVACTDEERGPLGSWLKQTYHHLILF
jgi:hypothetical protein